MDRRERYLGLLTAANAREALRAGVRRMDEAMVYVDQEYAAVSPAANFDELIPRVMSSDYPIPVTGADNLLVGEVHRSALAEALAETSGAAPDYAANAAANAAQQRWRPAGNANRK